MKRSYEVLEKMGALTVAFVKHLLRSWEESWWKTIEFRSSHNNVPRIRLILQWKIGQKLQFSSQIWHWRRRWVSEIRGLYRSQFFWGMKMTRISKSAFILASGVISWKIEMHLNLAMMTHFPCLAVQCKKIIILGKSSKFPISKKRAFWLQFLRIWHWFERF